MIISYKKIEPLAPLGKSDHVVLIIETNVFGNGEERYSVSAWSVQVPAGEYDGSICAVCRHGGRCKCQIANTMDRSVQCVGMVGPSASW